MQDSKSMEALCAIDSFYRMDEATHVDTLLALTKAQTESHGQACEQLAETLVTTLREKRLGQGGIDAFLLEYDLSSEEGIALMCLAEALLRIPDASTVDRLIQEKLGQSDWAKHLGQSDSLFVNASTMALVMTGKLLQEGESLMGNALQRFMQRSTGPVIRQAVLQAMKILGRQFVMGRSIHEAIKRAKKSEKKSFRYSYDMLGEAAQTEADAKAYYDAYLRAIEAVGQAAKGRGPIQAPGVSVKLSALYAHYDYRHIEAVFEILYPRILALAQKAKSYDIQLTLDAEEADRLLPSLMVIESLMTEESLKHWDGLGLAVQAYQKRALAVIDWVVEQAKSSGQRLTVRLVKGAYWDTEIKLAQMQGLDYPVFTRKANTDVSYLVCAQKLLAASPLIYPQFATHNAHTVASILTWSAAMQQPFEFQCLHGMGEALYQTVLDQYPNVACRIYAPVGTHQDLLAYLVRRLLENGANASFVNAIASPDVPVKQLTANPAALVQSFEQLTHPNIPAPSDLYAPERPNAPGIDLSHWPTRQAMQAQCAIPPEPLSFELKAVHDEDAAQTMIQTARVAQKAWGRTTCDKRAEVLRAMAKQLHEHQAVFFQGLIHEAGKTIEDAISEWREAIDFCEYYAQQASATLADVTLPGPTGEINRLQYRARGVILCISPWNFPLAIFLGQVVAGLVTGNAVIAKPAPQTQHMAETVYRCLLDSGLPEGVLQLVAGDINTAKQLTQAVGIDAVLFTGSCQTAALIQKTLAQKPGPLTPLVAETGGQNAMIVDSSALHEQSVSDVIQSAFYSAGQRCSATRVVFIQDDCASQWIEMLTGAMALLHVGKTDDFAVDIGPVIDKPAFDRLSQHIAHMDETQTRLMQTPLSETCQSAEISGHYFIAPTAFEISDLSVLSEETFGPILHVIRYQADELDRVIEQINATGYGLTLGIHSRVQKTIDTIIQNTNIGNYYVNRNMVGAVVGVQPFGGQGLSGTGPKAGGPNYLKRLCVERTISINATAAGGNASLMALEG